MLKSSELTAVILEANLIPNTAQADLDAMHIKIKDSIENPHAPSREQLEIAVRLARREVSTILNRLNDARRVLGQAQFALKKATG